MLFCQKDSERVFYVDVQIDKNKIRIIAYAPHARHSGQDFAIFLEQLQCALHGAYKNGCRVILGGNLQIDVGKRGEQMMITMTR